MSLRFIIGPSGSGKTKFLIKEVMEKALANPKEKFLYIVPDQFTMEMQKAMVLASPGKAILNIEVLSFGRLAHRIFEELGAGDEKMLDDTGKNLIIQRLAIEHRGELNILGKRANSPAVIHEIKSAISEFMQYSVGEERIDELIEAAKTGNRNALSMKLADIKLLYSLFMKEISGKYTTTEGRMGLLKKNVCRSKIVDNAVIVFDGFTGFTPIQLEVITELLIYAKEVSFSLIGEKEYMEKDLVPQELFALSKRTIASVRKCAKEAETIEVAPIYFDETYRFKNEGLKNLENSLFRRRNISKKLDGIKLYSCKNSREEVKLLGRKILSLVRQEGYAYRDIAVICGDISTYKDDIAREFERRNVPCFIDSPVELSVNPVVQFISSALSVLDSDFIQSETIAYLRSGLCPLEDNEADFLENFIIERGIRGKSRWQTAFFGRNPKNSEDEFNRAEELRELFMDSLSALDDKNHSVPEFVAMLRKFLEDNNFETELEGMTKILLEAGNQKKADEFLQVYEYIQGVFDVMTELSDKTPVSLHIFRELFAAALIEIKIGTIPKLVDRVLVGDLERTRLSEIKVLFFLGVNDGNIPKGTNKGGIISDLDRQFLSEKAEDIELAPTPRELMYRQRLYLYMTVTKPSEKLFVTYSICDIAGKEKLPSYFVETLKNYFEGLEAKAVEDNPEGYMEISDGFSLLAKGLRDFAKGFEPKNSEKPEVLAALFELCSKNEKLSALLYSMINGAFYQVVNDPLNPETTEKLYGKTISGSISRLQVFATCPYQYFLKYGLKLKEEPKAEVTPRSGGLMLHEILQKFGQRLKDEDKNWYEISEEEKEIIFEEIIKEISVSSDYEAYTTSGKNKYLRDYISRTAKKSVDILTKQLEAGGFKPAEFEKKFKSVEDLKKGFKMELHEVIDRIDVYENEQGEKYVKIIDYKTGNEDFSPESTAIGTKLQLPVYMKRALDDIKNAAPGAMFYDHAADPMVETESDGDDDKTIAQMLQSELAPRGLVNNSQEVLNVLDKDLENDAPPYAKKGEHTYLPSEKNWVSAEDIVKICDYSFELCNELANKIVEGDISASVYEDTSSNKNHCGYCPYTKFCRANPVAKESLKRKPDVKDVNGLIAYIDEKKSKEGEE